MALHGNTELAAIGNEYIKRIATSSTATKIRPEPVSADERQNAQKSGHNEKRPTVSKMFFGSALPPPPKETRSAVDYGLQALKNLASPGKGLKAYQKPRSKFWVNYNDSLLKAVKKWAQTWPFPDHKTSKLSPRSTPTTCRCHTPKSPNGPGCFACNK